MFGYIKKSVLVEQEKKFEVEIEFKNQAILNWNSMYTELVQKYEDNLEQLRVSVELEGFLNQQNLDLHKKLIDAKADTLSESRFNIKKAVTLLTTKLTDKALAKFLHDLITDLPKSKPSHVKTAEDYIIKAKEMLTKISKDGKEI